jgi:quaternary ammonium compound-resistance protein SugE
VAWLVLVVAGLFEVVWAFTMKHSGGFTRLWPSVVTLAAMMVSFGLLAWSMRVLPLGTAYTVWTGIGAVGAFIVGIVVLGETVSALRVVAAVLIVSGLLLMKLSSPE